MCLGQNEEKGKKCRKAEQRANEVPGQLGPGFCKDVHPYSEYNIQTSAKSGAENIYSNIILNVSLCLLCRAWATMKQGQGQEN